MGSIFHCIEFLNFSIIHNYYKYHLLIHYYVVIGYFMLLRYALLFIKYLNVADTVETVLLNLELATVLKYFIFIDFM